MRTLSEKLSGISILMFMSTVFTFGVHATPTPTPTPPDVTPTTSPSITATPYIGLMPQLSVSQNHFIQSGGENPIFLIGANGVGPYDESDGNNCFAATPNPYCTPCAGGITGPIDKFTSCYTSYENLLGLYGDNDINYNPLWIAPNVWPCDNPPCPETISNLFTIWQEDDYPDVDHFNLLQYNADFMNDIHEIFQDFDEHGLYLQLTLFDYCGCHWDKHPFRPLNNSNPSYTTPIPNSGDIHEEFFSPDTQGDDPWDLEVAMIDHLALELTNYHNYSIELANEWNYKEPNQSESSTMETWATEMLAYLGDKFYGVPIGVTPHEGEWHDDYVGVEKFFLNLDPINFDILNIHEGIQKENGPNTGMYHLDLMRLRKRIEYLRNGVPGVVASWTGPIVHNEPLGDCWGRGQDWDDGITDCEGNEDTSGPRLDAWTMLFSGGYYLGIKDRVKTIQSHVQQLSYLRSFVEEEIPGYTSSPHSYYEYEYIPYDDFLLRQDEPIKTVFAMHYEDETYLMYVVASDTITGGLIINASIPCGTYHVKGYSPTTADQFGDHAADFDDQYVSFETFTIPPPPETGFGSDYVFILEKADDCSQDADVSISTNQYMYHPGDNFIMNLIIECSQAMTADLYVVLDVYGEYWFYTADPPQWTYGMNLNHDTVNLSAGMWAATILEFGWPDTGDSANGIRFHAALFEEGTYDVIDYSSCEFGWEPSVGSHNRNARYYVDASNGDDTNGDGSCGSPWESIQHAMETIPASESARIDVIVLPGTYSVSTSDPIEVPDNVVLTGSGPASALIDGDDSIGQITLGDEAGLSRFTLTDCGVSFNSAATVQHNIFTGTTNGNLPLVDASGDQPTKQLIMNNLFHNNTCKCVISCSGTTEPSILNCTITQNTGDGIVCTGSSEPEITNNILSDNNGTGLTVLQYSSPTVSYNDFDNTTNFDGIGSIVGTDGNISEDPLFETGDFHNYYLSQTTAGENQTSPCADSGTRLVFPPYLLYGTTRTDAIADRGTFDMGYHELGMKECVEYTNLNCDFSYDALFDYIGERGPSDFVGIGDSGRIEVYLNDGEENLELSDDIFPTSTIACRIAELTSHSYWKDIAAAYVGSVIIYANDGTGHFDEHQEIDPSSDVMSLEIADIGAERWLDLIIGTEDGADIYFNDYYGTFTLHQHLDGDDIAFLACGDLDGDDDIDLVTANASGSNQIWLNDGGDFEEGQLIETESTSGISLEYVNGDAVLDLVITVDDCTTETYYGDNEGGFKQFTYIVPWFTTDVYAGQYWNTKVVLKNAGGFDGHAAFTYYDESGDEIADTKELLTVDGHGVVVRDLDEVASDTVGSVEITTDYETEGVVIYTYHNTNDTDHAMYSVPLQSTDELSADPQAPWYLSTTWSSDYTFGSIDSLSSLYLKNPTDDTVELTITYYYPDGTTADVDPSIEIDPHGVYSASMYWSMPSDAGSCEVEADGPLMGQVARCYTNTTTGEKFMHAEKLQHTEFAGTTMTTPYYLSYVDEDWYWESWFSVKNPWGDEVTATITYYNDDGDTVQTDNVSLDAHSTTMYGIIEGDPSGVGSVSISASDIVIGHTEIFGADLTNEKLCIGSEPLDCPEAGVLNYVVPWFESYDTQDVSVGTWITFQNPNGTTATIDLTYYDTDGEELTFTPSQIELDAHALQTIALTEGDPDDYGSIEITSDLPVTGQVERFAIYSSNGDLEYAIDPIQKVK